MADDTHETVLAAVDRLAEYGGLSLRPASLHIEAPAEPAAVPHEPGERGPLKLGADAGQLARMIVPVGLLALVGMLVLAGVVTGVAFALGVLAAVGVAVVGMIGVGGLGAFVVLRLSRRSLAALPAPATAVSWESTQPWPVTLAQSAERRLVFVAVEIVRRIAASPAWASTYLDEHRIRLDLVTELDEIDAQACRLAQLRDHPDVHRQGWDALVDRVSALSDYADRLTAMVEQQATRTAPDDEAARLLAGSVRDELATDQVRSLTRDLPEITSSETSRRNAT